ncbi:ATP-dependent nuclease [Mycobacterium colombiense]|uniref:ATP-dependent nuclease n=1 Tax=Mycobacterium colombiense TaxID=339268 RepID=UPI00131A3C6E|nr:AAA family ATPase [Mycobacterium colombiense]
MKDIQGLARIGSPHYRPRTIIQSEICKNSEIDIRSWVIESMPSVAIDGIPKYHVVGWTQVAVDDIVGNWNNPQLGVLTDLFIMFADGSGRLSVGQSESAIDLTTTPPNSPIQRAYQDPNLEKEIGQKCKEAFGLGVVIDRYAGSVIPLRLGDPPPFEHESGRPTTHYLEELKKLPRLEEQGDGVKSYMGLVLTMLAGHHEIILIDEPEAFLHPPQARLLARVLAERARSQQVFLATHSSSIVQGALEANGSTTIVRITREGDVNHAAVLKDQDVKDLWSDPLLRYSNLLDGLFHDAVVLCESDSDCRYYQAVLDALDAKMRGLSNAGLKQSDAQVEVAEQGVERTPQLLFTHCGGKARMASVVNALTAVSVPVIVVTDFDILRDRPEFEKLVNAVGGTFEGAVATDREKLDAALTSDAKTLRRASLREAINAAIDQVEEEVLKPKEAERIRAIIRAESGWDKAKRSGKAAVPQGDAYSTCERLLDELERLGILVVPVGELEGFARTVGGHGPGWVTEVLSRGLHESPGSEALEFVQAIRRAAQRFVH